VDWSGARRLEQQQHPSCHLPHHAESTTAHGGSSAVRGEVLDASGYAYAPVLQNLTQPVSGTPSTLTGWYQFSPAQQGDQMTASITIQDANNGTVALGFGLFSAEQSSYTQFSLDIDYSQGNGNPATNAVISFTIAGDGMSPAIGSWFLLDDLELETGAGVDDATHAVSIGLPYPQPAVHAVSIPLHVNTAERITVQAFDGTGRLVEELLNATAVTDRTLQWNTEGLANGVYLLRVRAGDSTSQRPIVVQH
jgi:hypothetical protein